MFKTLLHQTVSPNEILKDGRLRTAAELGKRGTRGEDRNVVYFTPTNNVGIPIPLAKKHTAVFHFDAPSLMKDHPVFFVNEGNAFGPLNGKPNARGTCACRNTYNSHTKQAGPCVHEELRDLEELLVFSLDYCDGGPELGIYESIPLEPYLMYVTLPQDLYDELSDEVKAKYGDKLRVNPTGGRRRRFSRHV